MTDVVRVLIQRRVAVWPLPGPGGDAQASGAQPVPDLRARVGLHRQMDVFTATGNLDVLGEPASRLLRTDAARLGTSELVGNPLRSRAATRMHRNYVCRVEQPDLDRCCNENLVGRARRLCRIQPGEGG